ncbi:unnamed protein product, partial [Nesidiocoris tenuis]
MRVLTRRYISSGSNLETKIKFVLPNSCAWQVRFIIDPPEVDADETWVHSGIGNQAILTCTVYAEPPAE